MEKASIYDEKDLLPRVADGDEAAFRMLYDRYRKRIYGLGLFITKSESLAQELLQDVFLKVWEKREQLRDVVYFNAWLRTVARNTAINYLRAQSVEKLGLSHLPPEKAIVSDTENEIADREYTRMLETAVNLLPPQQRKVFILHRREGLPHEEVASHLHISVYTSKKYMKLALRSIRLFIGHRMDSANLLILFLISCGFIFF